MHGWFTERFIWVVLLHHMDMFYKDMNGEFAISPFCITYLFSHSQLGPYQYQDVFSLFSYRKTTCSINSPAYSSVSAWQNTAASFSCYIIQLSLCRIVVTLNLVAIATALSSGEYWSVRNPRASVCAAIGAFLRIHGPAWASDGEREMARETKQALNLFRSVFL